MSSRLRLIGLLGPLFAVSVLALWVGREAVGPPPTVRRLECRSSPNRLPEPEPLTLAEVHPLDRGQTAFPVPGARFKISVHGGTSPTWAPDGSALYYFEGTRMIAVAIETTPTFRVTGRRQLFEGDFVQYRWSRQYDILPDGSGFVMIKNPPRGNVEVITRWFDELEKLADDD